ncbi:interferon-inducible GTPase 5-like [Thalassophryne amazonica]|uniref:interferon-inducible GTPase 5-like n=1 Tax=Thalassophryne amazonica TaxID=390379 RepID=UPI00147095C9|nr:interferon-inducible GTPase 5-like [Thalassophryne amazonica]
MDIRETFKEIKAAMEESPAAGAAKVQELLEKQDNIPLNIGVTGETGAGKSTFINAFRGLKNTDEGAAPVDCTETTMEVQQYPHPNYPNVILWDMPGIGSMTFQANEYLKKVNFEIFDFFVIISADRFREHDMKLALEIQKMNKKFYFVRSKIDHSLRDARDDEKDFNKQRTLSKIRENCVQNLQKLGFQAPQVFLVSSRRLHLHDFSLLHETLERELPAHKRDALLHAMPIVNAEILKKKEDAFHSKIKWWATLSGSVGLIPVPGVSMAVDIGLLVGVVKKYQVGLRLDKKSLENLSHTTGVPLSELQAVMKSPLGGQKITGPLLVRLLSMGAVQVTLIAVEEGLRFLPVIGFLGAIVSFVSTYQALKFFLNMLAEDAQNVFRRALGLNTSV